MLQSFLTLHGKHRVELISERKMQVPLIPIVHAKIMSYLVLWYLLSPRYLFIATLASGSVLAGGRAERYQSGDHASKSQLRPEIPINHYQQYDTQT